MPSTGELTKQAEIRHERGSAGIWGHAKPVRDRGLKSRAFGAKTGGASSFFGRIGESGSSLGLQQSARTRPSRYGRTGRNVIRGLRYVHTDVASLRFVGKC